MSGFVHIYCGDGKGKTTAALGLALRAAGSGMKVVIARFLKNDGSGEVPVLGNIPDIHVLPCEKEFGFTWNMTKEQKLEAGRYYGELFERAWEEAYAVGERVQGIVGTNVPEVEMTAGTQGCKTYKPETAATGGAGASRADLTMSAAPCGNCRVLLVLDEIMSAVSNGFVAEEQLLEALDHRPDGLEVVLTGRNPSGELMSRADYVTEMKAIKHPYEKGVAARKGIEY